MIAQFLCCRRHVPTGLNFFIFVTVIVLLLFSSSLSLSACDTALKKIVKDNMPLFMDNSIDNNLQKCVEKSLAAFDSINGKEQFILCGNRYSVSWLKQSLAIFLKGVETWTSETDFQNFLSENFDVCQAQGTDGKGQMLVTGYYEPIFAGSLTKIPPFIYPLYRVPPDLIIPNEKRKRNEGGRMQDGFIVPYWTREEIEKRDLLQGREIVYLADPVDAFILHVQGSGRIRLPDGSQCRVHFAASNGREYRSIGRLLAERGIIPLEEVTLPKIVSYLHDHPAELPKILYYNDRYIFFSISYPDVNVDTDNENGPAGSIGQPLTAGRSLALDNTCFPAPMVGYLETELPVFDENGAHTGWKSLRRFVVNQDAGAAIKGPGRVDFFLGGDDYAARAAGVMKQQGFLYFLLLKKEKM